MADYQLTASEQGNRAFRRSLYLVRDIAAGDVLTAAHIKSVRPALGLPRPITIGSSASGSTATWQPISLSTGSGLHKMNEELLRHHLAIIEQRWPRLAAHLTVAQLGDLQVELCEGLSSTLLVNGIQLTSRHDRVAEAELQAATLPDGPVLHLYGTGLGDLQKVLLARPG